MEKDVQRGLVVFQDKKIRRLWFNDEWFYSVADIVGILVDQEDFQTARKYWNKLSQRLHEEGSEVVANCHRLKLPAADGKLYETDCANARTLFRVIQSIPSKKAEPFKLWLAQVGKERIEEIENPELAQKRMKEVYKAKGYSDEWIEKRARGIAIRDELTDEWKKRGVAEEKDFAILTAEISKATFGMTPSEYKHFKGLKEENLRDHMDDLELIFSMLGEKVSSEISKAKDCFGHYKLKDAARSGGRVAGNARIETEKELGRSVASSENYLFDSETKRKKISRKN